MWQLHSIKTSGLEQTEATGKSGNEKRGGDEEDGDLHGGVALGSERLIRSTARQQPRPRDLSHVQVCFPEINTLVLNVASTSW